MSNRQIDSMTCSGMFSENQKINDNSKCLRNKLFHKRNCQFAANLQWDKLTTRRCRCSKSRRCGPPLQWSLTESNCLLLPLPVARILPPQPYVPNAELRCSSSCNPLGPRICVGSVLVPLQSQTARLFEIDCDGIHSKDSWNESSSRAPSDANFESDRARLEDWSRGSEWKPFSFDTDIKRQPAPNYGVRVCDSFDKNIFSQIRLGRPSQFIALEIIFSLR
jgi:hypothetical protein